LVLGLIAGFKPATQHLNKLNSCKVRVALVWYETLLDTNVSNDHLREVDMSDEEIRELWQHENARK
jgi:hypothetical protein